MGGLPDPEWYFEHVLVNAAPGTGRVAEPGPAAQWREWWDARTGPTSGLTALLHRQGFVATTRQLAHANFSEQRRVTRLRRGEWFRAARGFICPLDLRDADPFLVARRQHAVRTAAAVLSVSDHAASGRSGAVLHGLPVFALPARPEVTDDLQNGLGRRRASHVYGASIDIEDVTSWFGVAVLGVSRVLVDLGRHDRRDAIMAADAALRERLVTRAEIDRSLDQAIGWPGVRQAREVLALADPRAESPLESLARLVLHDDGFPPPDDLQRWFGHDRVDMVFDRQRLIIEIDGLGKYATTTPADEKRRERRLRRHGYRVERLTLGRHRRELAGHPTLAASSVRPAGLTHFRLPPAKRGLGALAINVS